MGKFHVQLFRNGRFFREPLYLKRDLLGVEGLAVTELESCSENWCWSSLGLARGVLDSCRTAEILNEMNLNIDSISTTIITTHQVEVMNYKDKKRRKQTKSNTRLFHNYWLFCIFRYITHTHKRTHTHTYTHTDY